MIIQDLTQDSIMEPPEEFPVVESESLPSSAKQKIDLVEAKGVLASMSLISVTFGHYLLVMRSQYDVMLSGGALCGAHAVVECGDGKVRHQDMEPDCREGRGDDY